MRSTQKQCAAGMERIARSTYALTKNRKKEWRVQQTPFLRFFCKQMCEDYE